MKAIGFLSGAIFSLIAFGFAAAALSEVRPVRDHPAAPVIEGLVCAGGQWTGWHSVYNRGQAHFDIDFDDDGTAATTAVTMRCETHESSATANDAGRDLHGTDGGVFAAGALTLNSGIVTWSNAITLTTESWSWTITNLPNNFINCLFTCTGGDADDVITVSIRDESP